MMMIWHSIIFTLPQQHNTTQQSTTQHNTLLKFMFPEDTVKNNKALKPQQTSRFVEYTLHLALTQVLSPSATLNWAGHIVHHKLLCTGMHTNHAECTNIYGTSKLL